MMCLPCAPLPAVKAMHDSHEYSQIFVTVKRGSTSENTPLTPYLAPRHLPCTLPAQGRARSSGVKPLWVKGRREKRGFTQAGERKIVRNTMREENE